MGISESKVREIIKIAQEPVSLETPIGEEEDSHLGDFIEDENAPAPAEVASNAMMREQLQEVLHTLTPREEKVIRLRFGLEDGQAHTLEEVGKEFNVTRERIRQIEAKALRKIRHPGRSKKLRDYYTNNIAALSTNRRQGRFWEALCSTKDYPSPRSCMSRARWARILAQITRCSPAIC